jgi:glycosyltransferase involved in cell wall biosynthesis
VSEAAAQPNDVATEESLEFTLLMPCLNEALTLETCIAKARGSLEKLGLDGEVLIADNGSTDDSVAIAQRAGARVVHVPKKGYGAALLGGIEAARGRFVIMGDADDSYDWSRIEGFVEKLRAGRDLVMGCRMPRGGGTVLPGAMPWLHRWLGNPGLSFAGRVLFGCRTTDFHCGMRGFDRRRIAALGLRCPGMEFATEMVARATLAGLDIGEVPVTLHPDGRDRPPHLRTWRDGWRHLRFMLLLSPKMLFFVPGVILTVLGLAGFSWLAASERVVFGLRLQFNSLILAGTLGLLGVQLLSFGLAARLYAHSRGIVALPSWLQNLRTRIHLEHGAVAGLILLLTAGGLFLSALWAWSERSFGDLEYDVGLRRVIASVFAAVLGAQILFGSFFVSFFSLQRD